MTLPAAIDAEAFDRLHDEPALWHDVVASIAAEHADAPVSVAPDGTALVGLVGDALVVKLYPPFLRDHFEFEREVMDRLAGRLRVPTPRRIASGERDGWPYIVMTRLPGTPLDRVWDALAEPERRALLAAIGALAAEVHALDPGPLVERAPPWERFIRGQRERCAQRQRHTGLPAHLLVQLEPFVAGELPFGRAVILTGEYTPMNLLHGPRGLAGMYDFGDGLVGPREYDWLGPLCFLAAGDRHRCDAFFEGYGVPFDRQRRASLLRLLLLHRYSNLRGQIAFAGWEEAQSFDALAETIWP